MRLLNDVGHELKTPITIIRGHLELLDAANVSDVEATRALSIEELDRMSTLVSDISLLAASRAPHFVTLAEVDIVRPVRIVPRTPRLAPSGIRQPSISDNERPHVPDNGIVASWSSTMEG